jgi:hypothetical protein
MTKLRFYSILLIAALATCLVLVGAFIDGFGLGDGGGF